MNKQQTAIEWLFQQLWETPKDKLTWYSILKKAKAMEKEQIVDACEDFGTNELGEFLTGKQYYNKTYKSE